MITRWWLKHHPSIEWLFERLTLGSHPGVVVVIGDDEKRPSSADATQNGVVFCAGRIRLESEPDVAKVHDEDEADCPNELPNARSRT